MSLENFQNALNPQAMFVQIPLPFPLRENPFSAISVEPRTQFITITGKIESFVFYFILFFGFDLLPIVSCLLLRNLLR